MRTVTQRRPGPSRREDGHDLGHAVLDRARGGVDAPLGRRLDQTGQKVSGDAPAKISMSRLMRNTGRHEIVARVNSRPFATLTLDFDLDADPVAGVVRTGADRGEPFAGWIALTRAIERTLDDARAAVSGVGPVDERTSKSDPSRSQP